ncbi:2-hydroxyacid dehydrogenase [Flavihumibacter petaseus]|uniref:Glyoxylate/hydroxypyruvate reductase B n=1 Tax=Flavihumibacter petaseus NBRC 106054 TaxID=1220578 RepID=A0A0E9N0T5_9BACT|nr:D-glycerate dehydrogenase [Flavihumibacter petaseus]GAO43444.1 glyoxylate reductase [Flavihumibacter petaseus NBRC 106054]
MRIFITRVIAANAVSLLETAGCQVVQHESKSELSPNHLISLLQDFDALLSVGGPVMDGEFLRRCRHLKAIALMSAGFDKIDLDEAAALGIPVSNTPGVLSNATADVAFLLMLAVSRNAFQMHKEILKGNWNFFDPMANLGRDLEGRTLGIFGMGNIGLVMARKAAAAFGMKILYHNRSKLSPEQNLVQATWVDFDTLLQESDVISVHANLYPATTGIFNRDAFRRMKPGAIFINAARGKIHEEQALIEALQKGWIWGAGLDVTNPEPMAPGNPLLEMPNVCVLPHIGSATLETRTKMAVMAAENLIAVKNGLSMPQQITPRSS